jgi:type I restriction enzyme S subunit
LLVAEDGSVVTDDGYPVLQLANGRFWVNNHAHIVRGLAPVSTEFLYLALTRYPIRGHITGAAQPKITQASLNRIPIVIAPADVMARFNLVAQDLIALRIRLGGTNEKLAAASDLLLPRLMSGELTVADAERALETAA